MVTSLRPSGNVASTWTSVQHLGDAGHHLVAGEHLAAGLHQLRDAAPSRARSITQVLSRATASG